MFCQFTAEQKAVDHEFSVLKDLWQEPAVPGIVSPVKLLGANPKGRSHGQVVAHHAPCATAVSAPCTGTYLHITDNAMLTQCASLHTHNRLICHLCSLLFVAVHSIVGLVADNVFVHVVELWEWLVSL